MKPRSVVRRAVFMTGLLVCWRVHGAGTQVPAIGNRPTQRQVFCNFGQPKPACDVFPLAEFGYNLKTSGVQRSPYFDFELGVMKNLTNRICLGGTGSLGFGKGHVIAFKPRVRWWLTDLFGMELAGGPVVAHDSGVFPSWVGHAGVNLGDRFSLVVQHDHLKLVGSEIATSWFLGARVGLGGFVLSNFRGSDRTCRGPGCRGSHR